MVLRGAFAWRICVAHLRDGLRACDTNSHGWQLGEHGEWGKFTNFELGTRIPLIISLPPSLHPNPGTVSSALVEEIDIFPTLLDAVGLPPPPQRLHGASLMPLMHEPARVSFKANASFSQYPR